MACVCLAFWVVCVHTPFVCVYELSDVRLQPCMYLQLCKISCVCTVVCMYVFLHNLHVLHRHTAIIWFLEMAPDSNRLMYDGISRGRFVIVV